jgi:hypothetical protein
MGRITTPNKTYTNYTQSYKKSFTFIEIFLNYFFIEKNDLRKEGGLTPQNKSTNI